MSYTLIGAIGDIENHRFSFLVPIYECQGKYYRTDVNNFSRKIIDFGEIKIDRNFFTKINASRVVEIGDKAIYLITFQNKIEAYMQPDIDNFILNNLRLDNFNPIEKYDVYSFLDMPTMVNESIQEIIEYYSDSSIKLSKKNFFTPDFVEVGLDEFRIMLKYYSTLFKMSKSFFSVDDFLSSKELDPEFVNLGRYMIRKISFKDNFNSLLEFDLSEEYRDLVCYWYCKNDLDDVRTFNNTDYRIRKLFELKTIDLERLGFREQILKDNSQLWSLKFLFPTIDSKNIEDQVVDLKYRTTSMEFLREEMNNISSEAYNSTFRVKEEIKKKYDPSYA